MYWPIARDGSMADAGAPFQIATMIATAIVAPPLGRSG